jgi:hypothetical protein
LLHDEVEVDEFAKELEELFAGVVRNLRELGAQQP